MDLWSLTSSLYRLGADVLSICRTFFVLLVFVSVWDIPSIASTQECVSSITPSASSEKEFIISARSPGKTWYLRPNSSVIAERSDETQTLSSHYFPHQVAFESIVVLPDGKRAVAENIRGRRLLIDLTSDQILRFLTNENPIDLIETAEKKFDQGRFTYGFENNTVYVFDSKMNSFKAFVFEGSAKQMWAHSSGPEDLKFYRLASEEQHVEVFSVQPDGTFVLDQGISLVSEMQQPDFTSSLSFRHAQFIVLQISGGVLIHDLNLQSTRFVPTKTQPAWVWSQTRNSEIKIYDSEISWLQWIAGARGISPTIAKFVDLSNSLREEWISGAQTPNERELDRLVGLIDTIQETGDERARVEMQSVPMSWESLRGHSAQPPAENPKYGPKDFYLRNRYQRLILSLNRNLSPSSRIPFRKIPYDQRLVLLREEARTLVQAQEKKFEKFFEESAFKNIKEFRKAVSSSISGNQLMIHKALEKTKIRPMMAVQWSLRDQLVWGGIHNQYVTGSSKGTLQNDWRHGVEANAFGLSMEAYKNMDHEIKPKYGFLGAPLDPDHQLSVPDVVHYGDDFYVFKWEKILDRMTWTAGDSLSLVNRNAPAASWDRTFVPWKFRSLILNFFGPNAIHFNPSVYPESPIPNAALERRYFEMQIWGPLSLDDVAEFEFHNGRPPTGNFLKELLRRGILIRDGKTMKEWKP